jgi:hypothetical protein
MTDFAPALAHGPITEIFKDVFSVTGGFRFGFGMSITRNMTIVRQGTELTLLNSVRLSPEGEKELEKLGNVKHLVRVGAFHGIDDPYYQQRYSPTLWAPPKIKHLGSLKTDEELAPGHAPIAKAQVFAFEHGKRAEVAILLEQDGGTLITCDSYQNWSTFDGCSFMARTMMPIMGFGPAVIGGPWVKAMGTDVKQDFDRMMQLKFENLIPAHGTPIVGKAKESLPGAIAKRFKS